MILLTFSVGLAVGSGFVTVVHFAARRGARAAEVANTAAPDGVEHVIDALESAGIVLDPSNNVTKVSPGALATSLVWHNALVHDELVAFVDEVRTSGEPATRELELPRGPFGEANIHVSVRVARLGSRYMLVLAEDRTESHRLDEVRRDFVANISHELKTPIGAVGLLAEALVEASDDPDQVRRFASRLTTESSRLARLTQEIIELSRLQAKDALAKPDLVDIDRVISAAIDHNRVVADKHSVTVVKGAAEESAVWGDESMLIVAVQNLISNAVYYSPAGGRVGIGVNLVDGVVEISVSDQGIGIPEDDRDRVFERFFRVDQARSRNTGGTGLGLSIVKHTVQNHGGDIRVWSKSGHGSTFTVRLPEATNTSARALGVNQ